MIFPDILNLSFGIVIVFVRVAGAVMLLPGFGETSIPPTIRLGLSLALTTIIAPLIESSLPSYPQSVIVIAVLLVKEAVVGLILGWIARTIVLALPMAGQIISYQIGLSSVLLPDAELGPSSTILANAFNMAVPPLVLASGLFVVPTMALIHSFHLIPPGLEATAIHEPTFNTIIRTVIITVGHGFEIAMQLSVPFLVIGLIWQTGLAFMAKAAPQIQVYFVSMPVQIMGGLALLGAIAIPMISIWQRISLHYLAASMGL